MSDKDKESAQDVIDSYRKRQQQAQRAPIVLGIAGDFGQPARLRARPQAAGGRLQPRINALKCQTNRPDHERETHHGRG